MYFLSENMSFLRIVQIIDINPKKFTVSGYSFLPSQKRQNSKIASVFSRRRTGRRNHRETASYSPGGDKKDILHRGAKTGNKYSTKVNVLFQSKRNKEFYFILLVFFYSFRFSQHIFSKKDGLAFTSHFQQTSALYFPFTIFNRQQTPNKTKQDRLIDHIRLIEKFLSPCFHSFLSSVYFPFPSPCPVAARIRTHTNTTQNRTNDTFYFLREVIYYSFE